MFPGLATQLQRAQARELAHRFGRASGQAPDQVGVFLGIEAAGSGSAALLDDDLEEQSVLADHIGDVPFQDRALRAVRLGHRGARFLRGVPASSAAMTSSRKPCKLSSTSSSSRARPEDK